MKASENCDKGYLAEQAENLVQKDLQDSSVANQQVEPLSSKEYSAFLTGLAHYLETGSMELSLEIVQNQITEN